MTALVSGTNTCPVGTGSFTVPNDGTIDIDVVGGGGGGGKQSGGGGGANAQTTGLPVSAGDTVFFNIATAAAGNSAGNGTSGSVSWININVNSAPTSSTTGAKAAGGSSLNTGGTSSSPGGTTAASIGTNLHAGGAGSSGTGLGGGGGSGGTTGNGGDAGASSTGGLAGTGSNSAAGGNRGVSGTNGSGGGGFSTTVGSGGAGVGVITYTPTSSAANATVSQTIPAPSQTATVTVTVGASANQTTPAPTETAAATLTVKATVSQTTPLPAQAATATSAVPSSNATVTQTIPVPTHSGSFGVVVHATSNTTLNTLTSTATAGATVSVDVAFVDQGLPAPIVVATATSARVRGLPVPVVYLDRRVGTEQLDAASYNIGSDTTTYTLPYPATSSSFTAVSRDDKFLELEIASVSGHVVSLKGDTSAISIFFGEKYATVYTFSPIFMRDDTQQAAIQEGRLQLLKLDVAYSETGYFRAEVTPPGRQTFVYEFDAWRIGDSLPDLDTLALREGVFTVPVRSNAEDVSIKLINDSFLPHRWIRCEWKANFVPKYRK